MPPVLLTGRQLAERLDASYDDVLSWSRRDIIPSIRVSGRVYFDLKKVLRALNERATAAPEMEAAAEGDDG